MGGAEGKEETLTMNYKAGEGVNCEVNREIEIMFYRRGFPSLPLVIGAVVIGVVSGKAIFGPPLEEYWKKRLEEEATVKESNEKSQ